MMTNLDHLDHATRVVTAFRSFDNLLNARGGYRPSLNVHHVTLNGCNLGNQLACAYDAAQAARGDVRRAHRY